MSWSMWSYGYCILELLYMSITISAQCTIQVAPTGSYLTDGPFNVNSPMPYQFQAFTLNNPTGCNCACSSCPALCSGTCPTGGCLTPSPVTCQNPVGALYQCTLLSAIPASALQKLTFQPSMAASSTASNPFTICQLTMIQPLQPTDCLANNVVSVQAYFSMVQDCSGSTPYGGAQSYSMWYNFTVTYNSTVLLQPIVYVFDISASLSWRKISNFVLVIT
jgi:hypothetical protein